MVQLLPLNWHWPSERQTRDFLHWAAEATQAPSLKLHSPQYSQSKVPQQGLLLPTTASV